MTGDEEEPPPYEVLAALVASLRRELAEAMTALERARAELAHAQERIAELEARLKQNPRNSSRPPSSEALVPDLIAIARGRGVRRVEVTANQHALAFYHNAGFAVSHQVQTRFGPSPRMQLDVMA